MASTLTAAYPWTRAPLIAGAPMRLVAGAALATSVSIAGGLGFLGAGNDISTLESELSSARATFSKSTLPASDVLPLGVGFLIWGAPLKETLAIISKPANIPSAAWLFAPHDYNDFKTWSEGIRSATSNKTHVWIQVTSVKEALSAVKLAQPDVLVIQGTDAGGHGAAQGAGITALVPEAIDAVTALCSSDPAIRKPFFVAAGGISDGRGMASALTLGAQGVCIGTRYLASTEATIASGYRNAVLRAADGGVSTIRSSVYDQLRGTTDWPPGYGGRGVVNASFKDHENGLSFEENKALYDAALKSGDKGWEGDTARLTTYAGTGVGLVNDIQSAGDITSTVREDAISTLKSIAALVEKL